MTTDRQTRLAYKRNIRRYLRELSVLSGRIVTAADLVGVDRVHSILSSARAIRKQARAAFEMPFEAKSSSPFLRYVETLHQSNPVPIYIWTPRTNSCGPLQLESLKVVNFDFPFRINTEGIVSVVATNCQDEMILDFFEDPEGRQRLEVELMGEHWPRVPPR